MPSLSKQILDYVPEGKVVDRAQIALDADYDSIGRVLRKLVDDGKLVRVGRGRYRRRARGSTMSSNSIADRVARRVARSKRNVFLRRDFETFGSYDAVGRALRRVSSAMRAAISEKSLMLRLNVVILTSSRLRGHSPCTGSEHRGQGSGEARPRSGGGGHDFLWRPPPVEGEGPAPDPPGKMVGPRRP
ncbi:MAG: hypothetical protein F9K41_08215 [Sphingopyxis terrae]|nr:MAG: hypothetical protein F9K41_08215 [Sphingopyxis terrae]